MASRNFVRQRPADFEKQEQAEKHLLQQPKGQPLDDYLPDFNKLVLRLGCADGESLLSYVNKQQVHQDVLQRVEADRARSKQKRDAAKQIKKGSKSQSDDDDEQL